MQPQIYPYKWSYVTVIIQRWYVINEMHMFDFRQIGAACKTERYAYIIQWIDID